jgi:hypothetical protein
MDALFCLQKLCNRKDSLCRSSASDPDPHSMAAWIRIRIPNADPDPIGLKRAKKEGENASIRQIIRHRKEKKQCNLYKMGKYYFIFIQSSLLICLVINLCF